jgi:Family of unknown function (DUF5947)
VNAGLRRFVERPALPDNPEPDLLERCELCGNPAGERHGHVVDTENRALMCACRPCFLLFTRPDAGGGRFRAVPERRHHDPAHPLTRAEWEGLGIPVGSAFFLRSDIGTTAFYPSPAGATECLLDLDAWAELVTTHPLLAAAEPEVEAVLVRAEKDTEVECFLVPVDACYQLVGTVRMYWQGFDGGAEANAEIDEFFANVRAAATPLEG